MIPSTKMGEVLKFKIWRDCDAKRVRKVCIELWNGDQLVDRRRMFSFPLFSFSRRLERKQERMLVCAWKMMKAAEQ